MTSSGGHRPSTSPASIRRRRAIVDATRAHLRSHDLDKVVVADVAVEAGVSVATVYNLVGNREQLLVAVVDDYLDELDAELDLRDHTGDPVEDVLSVISTAIRLTLADPAPLRSIVRELGPLDLVEHRRRSLDDLIARRLPDGDDAATTARFIGYAVRGLLVSWANGMIGDDTLEHDGQAITRRLLTG